MRTVLVTGGIGSGKSLVSSFLAERGIPVYDSDSRTKALYEGPLLQRIEEAFGMSFRISDPSFQTSDPSFRTRSGISFAALGRAAFASSESLALLESIVHPAVLSDFTAWKQAQSDVPFVALESAIAMEKPLFDGAYDTVVLVYAPEQERFARIRQRNPDLSDEDIRRRLDAQPPDGSPAKRG